MQKQIKTVSIIGLGKLGVPIAASLAWRGYKTIGVDVDTRKVSAINDGVAPFFEPDLQDFLDQAKGMLTATNDIEKAVLESDITFIIVLTPSDETGGFSLKYVLEAGVKIGEAIGKKKDYHLVVLTSTVMPGATEGELKPLLEAASGKKCGLGFGLCYSPEFVALGTVIRDFLNPDFLLIGESDPRAGEVLENLLKSVCQNKPAVARMNLINAEITKVSVNSYVTIKISFANTIARICEQLPEADADVVASALGLDTRIGRKYLKGAIGYGGPCFPRDNLALASLARSLRAPATLAESTHSFNQQQAFWLRQFIKQHLPNKGTIGILGLAYKPQSDVVEQAQGLLLARALVEDKVSVIVFDPLAMKNAKRNLSDSVVYATTAEQCVEEADVVVITTPWEQFKKISPEKLKSKTKSRVLIDCWRLLEPSYCDGIAKYIALGMGSKK